MPNTQTYNRLVLDQLTVPRPTMRTDTAIFVARIYVDTFGIRKRADPVNVCFCISCLALEYSDYVDSMNASKYRQFVNFVDDILMLIYYGIYSV